MLGRNNKRVQLMNFAVITTQTAVICVINFVCPNNSFKICLFFSWFIDIFIIFISILIYIKY
jgi:hypothetical protein